MKPTPLAEDEGLDWWADLIPRRRARALLHAVVGDLLDTPTTCLCETRVDAFLDALDAQHLSLEPTPAPFPSGEW